MTTTIFALDVKKPVVLNSISQAASRGDLIDRLIVLKLDAIPESKRREESKLLAEFRTHQPEFWERCSTPFLPQLGIIEGKCCKSAQNGRLRSFC